VKQTEYRTSNAPVSGIPRTPLPGNSGQLDQDLALIHSNSPLYGPLSLA
jgi:hypothetical protein